MLRRRATFSSADSLEAVSVLQVEDQAVGAQVHFVLGLCHLQVGQTHTHNTQVRKQSIKSHDLSELLSLHKVNRKTASNQHVSGRRVGGTGFLSHCVLAPSGGLHGQLHCELPCKDQTGALGAGGRSRRRVI